MTAVAMVGHEADTSAEMTERELARFAELEAAYEVIETTVAAGVGILAEIHDGKLYRQTHSTFAAYLEDRWNISRARGYQLLNHAAVLERVSTTVDIPSAVPTVGPNERQARVLAKAPIDKQGSIWAEVVKTTGGKPTLEAVREAVDGEITAAALTFADAMKVWNRAHEIADHTPPDVAAVNQALAEIAPTAVGTASVSTCGVDNSFDRVLKMLRRDLRAMTREPTQPQADALRALLTTYLKKLS